MHLIKEGSDQYTLRLEEGDAVTVETTDGALLLTVHPDDTVQPHQPLKLVG